MDREPHQWGLDGALRCPSPGPAATPGSNTAQPKTKTKNLKLMVFSFWKLRFVHHGVPQSNPGWASGRFGQPGQGRCKGGAADGIADFTWEKPSKNKRGIVWCLIPLISI